MGQPGWTVNPLAYAYGGSSPPLPTKYERLANEPMVAMKIVRQPWFWLLGLLVLGTLGLTAWLALAWSVTDPLTFRLVELEKLPDGGRRIRVETRNRTLFPVHPLLGKALAHFKIGQMEVPLPQRLAPGETVYSPEWTTYRAKAYEPDMKVRYEWESSGKAWVRTMEDRVRALAFPARGLPSRKYFPWLRRPQLGKALLALPEGWHSPTGAGGRGEAPN